MAADQVFCTNHVWGGYVPKYFRSLPRLLMDYLGIESSGIFYPRYRLTHLAEDSQVWLTRPALPHLVLGAARNCLYLLPLHRQIRSLRSSHFIFLYVCIHHYSRVGNMFNVNLLTQLLNQSLRDKDDPEADRVDLDLLPEEFSQQFPGRRKNEYLTRNFQKEGNFVHQSVHSSDPLCRFSKDCMHQTQVI